MTGGIWEKEFMPKVTPAPKRVGRTYLRQWREYRRMLQAQVAAKMGIDRSHISTVENGKSPYNQNFLEAAASIYNCTVLDLLSRDPAKEAPLWTIFYELHEADPNTRQTAANVLRALLKIPE